MAKSESRRCNVAVEHFDHSVACRLDGKLLCRFHYDAQRDFDQQVAFKYIAVGDTVRQLIGFRTYVTGKVIDAFARNVDGAWGGWVAIDSRTHGELVFAIGRYTTVVKRAPQPRRRRR